MAQIPPDIQEGIKKLGEAVEVPTKSLVMRLKEIVETDDTIKTMEQDDFKIRYAWALLYREYSMAGKAIDFYFSPVSCPRVREITLKGDKTFVGDVTALVQKIEKSVEGAERVLGPVTYASGTFWRQGAKNLSGLMKGRVYKTALIAKENKWGITISSDRAGFAEVEHKMPDFKEFYNKEIESKNVQITIGEMDLNKSDNGTDIKVVQATVIESDVGEKDGKEYGRYIIMDDSLVGSGSNFAIFVAPKDVVWLQGSIIIFGGTIDIDKEGAVRWNNQFILPTDLAIKKDLIVKPVSEKMEEVDVGEVKTEAKKEEKKEDVDFEI